MQNNTFFGHYKPCSLIVLDKTSSTNDYIKQLLTNFKPQLPFTAIMAKEQTSGRGQRGTTWISQPNKNLTASFLYTPHKLETKNQFIISIISSLAIYDILKTFISNKIYIKWPNDIIVNNKKLAGILIENKISSIGIKHSIIGIGINVYTTVFPTEIMPKTTSLLLENFDFNLTLIDLIKLIQQRLIYYENLYFSGQEKKIWDLYSNCLFQKNIKAKYIINNKEVEGEILGVNLDGTLILTSDNQINNYDLKDIIYQL